MGPDYSQVRPAGNTGQTVNPAPDVSVMHETKVSVCFHGYYTSQTSELNQLLLLLIIITKDEQITITCRGSTV